MANFVVWFEIPVSNLDRAVKFYSDVFDIEMPISEWGQGKMAFFPFEKGGASGALFDEKGNTTSDRGTLIYLNGGDDLTLPLGRIEKAGGKILQGKISIGEHGFIAIFKDSEGNRVALHSKK